MRLFEYGKFPPESNYLFLGDYVDRGKQSLETICLLLAYKIKYPENFFILRGNHECASINRIYGFYEECKRRYDVKLWKTFTDCFNCLPIAAIIDEKILCMHGGLSPDLKSMDQIRRIVRPTDVPDTGLLCDLLWADPDKEVQGWNESDRGVSFTFGADVVTQFLKKQELDLICRAHQVVEDGYEFFAKRQLVTLFSAPNYCLSHDSQILTERGFLNLQQFTQAWTETNGNFKVASYSHSDKTILYERPQQFILNAHKKQQVVKISSLETCATQQEETAASSDAKLSMLVTMDHDMYVAEQHSHTSTNQADSQFITTKAANLLPSNSSANAFQFAAIAEAGISFASSTPSQTNLIAQQLALTQDKQVEAFLEWFGLWLGNGSQSQLAPANGQKSQLAAVSQLQGIELAQVEGLFATCGLLRGEDYSFVRTSNVESRLEVTNSLWTSFVERHVACGRNGVRDATRDLPAFVWTLNVACVRALLKGLIATGVQGVANVLKAESEVVRDAYVRLALHAGFTSSASKCVVDDDEEHMWHVEMSEEAQLAYPTVAKEQVESVEYEGRSWCVTMPSGYIWVRRDVCDAQGNVVGASRPTVLRNCGEFDNAGAMMSVDDTLMCSFQILRPAEKTKGAAKKPMSSKA